MHWELKTWVILSNWFFLIRKVYIKLKHELKGPETKDILSCNSNTMKDKENNETPTGDRGYEALFKSDNFNSPKKRKKWLGK